LPGEEKQRSGNIKNKVNKANQTQMKDFVNYNYSEKSPKVEAV
jgi:hypothetical protein